MKHAKASIPLMIVSLIIGYGFWHILGHAYTTQKWYSVPLTFYNAYNKTIDAPEMVMIQLVGTRTHLSYLNHNLLAAHIDATTLHDGPNGIALNEDTLLLPPSIKLVHYKPANIVATVTQN